jgi:hypothetical protein
MRNERYIVCDDNHAEFVLCETHSTYHDQVVGDLVKNLGETDKPCTDCVETARRKKEVRAAILDVLLEYFGQSDFGLAEELQRRLDALIDNRLL